jgi:DNA-directed RNA polymerase subunit M/transcription elongation factor TFIIS
LIYQRNIICPQYSFRRIISPMESVDQQLQQLKGNYEYMTEGELCALAENAYDLTEIAREALQAVISERGIAVRLKLEPPATSSAEPPDENLVIFGWPEGAEAAGRTMKILAAAGIPSFLSLEVRADDVKRAQAALQRVIDDELEKDDPEEKKEYAILCPKCHSAKVVLEGADTDMAKPPSTDKFQWNCDACGYSWTDEGTVQEAAGGQSWPGEEFPASSAERDPK